MDIPELVRALLTGDLLTARQCVADAQHVVQWDQLSKPVGLTERELTVAAGLVELLASRSGATPPAWTASVGALQEPLVLDPGLEEMPRSFARAQTAGPEPLRKRNIVASPGFLEVA
ncbi:MAG TPA: hypothetical protein VF618_08160 [Thermoanaerobaculia bacterium]